jgi:Domain of unknown function (DUF397)
MTDLSSGMSAAELTAAAGARWVASSHSGPTGGNCVEVAFLAAGRVAVRDSRHPSGPALLFPAAAWAAFAGAVAGESG